MENASLKTDTQKAIAESQAKLGIAKASRPSRQSGPDIQTPSRFVISVSIWLKKLDDDNKSNECPLNTGPFLDLADYLKKTMAQYTNAYGVHGFLEETAETILKAQNVIIAMLKQEANK